MVWEIAHFLFDMKLLSPYAPSVAHISTRISALGNIPALIHFTLCLVRHIEESKPIEHAVDVSHAPDVTQRFLITGQFSRQKYKIFIMN